MQTEGLSPTYMGKLRPMNTHLNAVLPRPMHGLEQITIAFSQSLGLILAKADELCLSQGANHK